MNSGDEPDPAPQNVNLFGQRGTLLEAYHHEDPKLVEMLAGYFREGSLVPVIGAGFTAGEKAKSGKEVPSGSAFMSVMIAQLSEHAAELTKEELEELNRAPFSEVADLYFEQDLVPRYLVEQTLEECFHEVELSEQKRAFLNDIDWKYIYTLNVDDAVEKNSKYTPVYPYDLTISDQSRNYRPVYKLHGDVYYELTHSEHRLVFRKASYLASIEGNRRMLEMLEEDFIGKNILFIGCSLSDEDDIAFLVASRKLEDKKSTRRVVFLEKEPGVIESRKLKRHGVNTVILYDHKRYDQIYLLIEKAYMAAADADSELDRYKLNLIELEADPEKNKSHLIAGVSSLTEPRRAGESILPYYYGRRNREEDAARLLGHGGLVIISGGRVSGRTLLARSIANSFRDRTVYFLESGVILETPFIQRLLGKANALIVFDSKTIDTEIARIIRRSEDGLRERATSVLVILESSDGHMIDALSSRRLETPPVVNLGRELHGRELDAVNEKLKEARCPAFRKNRKLLDNLFAAYRTFGENNVIRRIEKSPELIKGLYILGVARRLDGDWVRFIGATHNEIEPIVDDFVPYLEYEKIPVLEAASHAGYRVVCNSDAWLLAVLGEFYRSRGASWCSDRVFEIVREASGRNRRLAIDLSLFDSLNAMFGGEAGGAAELIIEFYSRLESLWGKDPEFFVQKAKAYYNMYREKDAADVLRKRLQELVIASSWAAAENNFTTERNIRHIGALVALRRAAEQDFKVVESVVDAIERTGDAIEREESNSEYVRQLADGKLRGSKYLRGLLDALEGGSVKDPKLLLAKPSLETIKARVHLH